MPNRDTAAAWGYHNYTKHSPQSVRANAHFLDWANQPLPFKIYEDLALVAFPVEKGRAQVPALQALCERSEPATPLRDVRDLASLLYFSAGVTRRRKYPGGEIAFRAAANTGALYEIDLYVVSGHLAGLAAGVYHFAPHDQTLRRLREGDFRGFLARATAQEPAVAEAPAVIVSTGTYWRNAWKYQARTYRHFGWDNGTIHANLLAMANALGIPTRLVCGFHDDEVNRLLALETNREVALALAACGAAQPAPPARDFPEIHPRVRPLSRREVDYPVMREMHEASSLASAGEAADWRMMAAPRAAAHQAPGEAVELAQLNDAAKATIEAVILRRGSARRFSRTPIRFGELSAILRHATCDLDADFVQPGAMLNDLYIIAHAVDGLRAGVYFYDSTAGRLHLLKTGNFRNEAAFLALEQDLAGDAAADIFFLSDLNRWLDRLGNRAYRAVQLEAGIAGGRAYLAAYALGLGASGLTFYDDEVTRFFSPHAADKSAIFLVGVGHPAAPAGTIRI